LRSGHKEEEEDEKIARIRLFSYQNNLQREREIFFSLSNKLNKLIIYITKKIYIYIKSVFLKQKNK